MVSWHRTGRTAFRALLNTAFLRLPLERYAQPRLVCWKMLYLLGQTHLHAILVDNTCWANTLVACNTLVGPILVDIFLQYDMWRFIVHAIFQKGPHMSP